MDRGWRMQASTGAVSIRYHRVAGTSERPTIWESSDFVLHYGVRVDPSRSGQQRSETGVFWRTGVAETPTDPSGRQHAFERRSSRQWADRWSRNSR